MSTRTLPPTQLRSVVTLTLSPSPPTTSVTSTFSAFARPPPPTNSTSSPINFLPAEVLALIIELAAGTRYERKRVLPGLALVARAWREPAQRELFRRPWIMSSGGADKWLKSPARKRYKVSSAALAGSLEGSANLAERLAGRIERTLQVAAELRGIETLYLCLYTTVDGKLFSLPALSGLKRLVFEDEGGLQTPASALVHHINPSFALSSLVLDGNYPSVVDAQFAALARPHKLHDLSLSLPLSPTPFGIAPPLHQLKLSTELPLLLAHFPVVAPRLRSLAISRSTMALFVEQPHLLAHLEDLETLFFKCDVTAPFMAILDAVLASNCKLRTIKLWFKRDACVDSLVSLLGHPALKDIKQWELLPAQPSYSWFNRCGELKASKFIEACEERGIEVGWTKNPLDLLPGTDREQASFMPGTPLVDT